MSNILPGNYAYLLSQIPTLLLVIAGFVIYKRERGMVLLSGLALTPFALSGFWFGDYWKPNRLTDTLVGVEDLLYCFAAGALVWLAAVVPMRTHVQANFTPSVFLKRSIMTSGPGMSVSLVLISLGAGIMTATLAALTVTIPFLIAVNRDHWPLSANAAAFVTVYYWLILTLGSVGFGRDFTSMWDGHEQWGLRVFDIPAEEYLWSILFPAAYALVIAWVADVRVVPRQAIRKS